MSYSVKSIEVFERQAKKLTKKYASLKSELLALVQDLKENPYQGTTTLAKAATKFAWSSSQKVRASLAGPG